MALFIDKLIHSLIEHDGASTPSKSHNKPGKKGHHHTKSKQQAIKDNKKKKQQSHSSPPLSHCARVKLDRVLADRKICCSLDIGPCDIGFAVPYCSVLNGTINVTVLECEPVICEPHKPVTLNILLLIEEEFTVTLPDGTKIPLEFAFHRKCTRCIPPIKTEWLDPSRIQCKVFHLKDIKSKLKFICADSDFDCHATIAVHLDVIIAINLVVEEQLCVALCRKHNQGQNRLDRVNLELMEERQVFCDEKGTS